MQLGTPEYMDLPDTHNSICKEYRRVHITEEHKLQCTHTTEEYMGLPDAHVVLLQRANELWGLAGVLLHRAHHAGSLSEEVDAGLWATHLKGNVSNLYVRW